MRLKEFWATVKRRWYMGIVALLITVIATLLVVVKVGPTYEAQGSVLVFPPVATVQRESSTEAQGNPFLVLNGVNQARDIAIRTLTAKSAREQLAASYPDASFEAVPDFTNSAPIILITVEADSQTSATAGLAAVMASVPTVLSDLQAGLNLSSDQVITSKPLIADQEPDAVRKGQIRAGIVAGAATLAFSLLLIGLIDGLLTGGRKARRPSRARSDKGNPVSHELATEDTAQQGADVPRRLGPRVPVSPVAVARRNVSDDPVRRLRSVSGQD